MGFRSVSSSSATSRSNAYLSSHLNNQRKPANLATPNTSASSFSLQQPPPPASSNTLALNEDLVKQFSSESLHSFSYAFISQNSISSRLDILKRSLEFLRDNPSLTNLSHFPSTSSTTALEGFFKPKQRPQAFRNQIRSSASSAALSMLANYPNIKNNQASSGNNDSSNNDSLSSSIKNIISSDSQFSKTSVIPGILGTNTGEPMHTLFDNNLKSILILLENAHVFPPSVAEASISPYSSTPKTSSASSSNSKLYSLLHETNTAQPSTPFRPIISRSATNPPLLLNSESSEKTNSISTSAIPETPLEASFESEQNNNNNNKPTLLEPARLRKRTKTNIATFHLQTQLLDALATPYYDPSWNNLIQRSGASVPTISTSMSTVDLKSAGMRNTSVYSSASSIIHPLSSRFTTNQAVFTTASTAPYLILASNDISCLVFGMSKAEIRRQHIADIIGPDFRDFVMKRATDSSPNTTFLCGELVPITKFNGQTGLASFFAKKYNSGIIAWVIEEIAHDKAHIEIDLQTGEFSLSGPQKDVLFPFIDQRKNSLKLHDILSGIPDDLHVLAERLRNDRCLMENHVTISGNTIVPCLIQTSDNFESQATSSSTSNKDGNTTDGEANKDSSGNSLQKLSVQLISIPHISGVILLNPSDGMKIVDYNSSVLQQLFGYSILDPKHCVGWCIDELIPNFTNYVKKIEETCQLDLKGYSSPGLVIPEHLFRKVAVTFAMNNTTNNEKQKSTTNLNEEEEDPDTIMSTPTSFNTPTLEGVSSSPTKDNSSNPQLPRSKSKSNSSSETLNQMDIDNENESSKAQIPLNGSAFDLGDDNFMPKKQMDNISAFMASKGIEGQHKDGVFITLDVQMRIIGNGYAALWVTYSRNITGQQETNQMPSQLSLLSSKKNLHKRLKKSVSSAHHSSNSSTGSEITSPGGHPEGSGHHSSASTQSGSSSISLSSLSDPTARSRSGSEANNISSPVATKSKEETSEQQPATPTKASSPIDIKPSSSSSSSPSTENASSSVNNVNNTSVTPKSKSAGSASESANDSNSGSLTHVDFSNINTPRSQVLSPNGEVPNSASSLYSIHIPELGARRREKKLSDFKILKKMGEGAYGKVILVEYKAEPHLKIVIKSIFKERILVDTWTRDRKLGSIPSEIKVMAVLNKWPHENIIKLLDFFEDDDYFHIELEPHGDPGIDLFDLIEMQGDLTEEQCKFLFKQVVSAVRHLHHHDIVHRDIKDENVIVDGEGIAKLIDFGSSAFIKQGPFDVFVGTIDYAAPEVLAGKPYEGKPQDIWALGILLYTIIYKENPFYNVDEIMEKDLRIPFAMSEESLDLTKLILTRDIHKRPTVDDIWNHPWLQDSSSDS